MNTTLSWIKAYVPDLDCTAQEYTDAMTLSGTKVEGYEAADRDLEKIVIGQIHAYDSQKPLIKVEYQFKEKTQTGNIVAKVRMRPDDSKGRVIIVAENVPLEKNFTYVIHLNKAGLLSVEAASGQWNERIGAAWGKKPLYFKAGVYVQDNSGDSQEGGKVTFARLDIDHN